MATDLSFVQYVVDTIACLGDVYYKKMFGEYCVYFRTVPVMLLCDDTAYIVINKKTTEIMGDCSETGYPYDGAKLHYVLDVDDGDLCRDVVRAVAEYRLSEKASKRKG